MRILVCGGRDYADECCVSETLLSLGPTLIIQGNAAGADDIASRWAEANHVPVMPFPADWGTFGRKAGPIRNQRMLDEGKPDLVVAFPGGAGTADMVRRAKKAGVQVVEVKALKEGEAARTAFFKHKKKRPVERGLTPLQRRMQSGGA